MARPSKPWFWAARDAWCVTIRGERVVLAKGKDAKAAATLAFHQLMASEGKVAPGGLALTVHVLANLFLQEQEARKLAPLTIEFYRRHLGSFVGRWGDEAASAIRPLNVSTWLREHDWADSTKAGAVASVKRLYNWAKKEGHLSENPLADIERPAMAVRSSAMTRQQAESILRASRNSAWKDFLIALWETGCRPGELAEVTAAQFDARTGTLRVKNKTRRKTREPLRTIHLTPFMVEICKELSKRHPEGPIFRNTIGNPWTRNSMACSFRAIRTRIAIPAGISAYSMRHGYVTDALENGVPVATVAALVGHTDATMILKVYSKLSSRQSHLRDAASLVRPASQNNPSSREVTE